MRRYVNEMHQALRWIFEGAEGEFRWDPNAEQLWESRFERAQKITDMAVLRYSAPYVPFDTGTLNRSGVLGTQIGSGVVEWNAPYARFQYYGKVMVGVESGSPWANAGERKVTTDRELNYNGGGKRGKLWFERMKADKKKAILAEARGAMRT